MTLCFGCVLEVVETDRVAQEDYLAPNLSSVVPGAIWSNNKQLFFQPVDPGLGSG